MADNIDTVNLGVAATLLSREDRRSIESSHVRLGCPGQTRISVAPLITTAAASSDAPLPAYNNSTATSPAVTEAKLSVEAANLLKLELLLNNPNLACEITKDFDTTWLDAYNFDYSNAQIQSFNVGESVNLFGEEYKVNEILLTLMAWHKEINSQTNEAKENERILEELWSQIRFCEQSKPPGPNKEDTYQLVDPHEVQPLMDQQKETPQSSIVDPGDSECVPQDQVDNNELDCTIQIISDGEFVLNLAFRSGILTEMPDDDMIDADEVIPEPSEEVEVVTTLPDPTNEIEVITIDEDDDDEPSTSNAQNLAADDVDTDVEIIMDLMDQDENDLQKFCYTRDENNVLTIEGTDNICEVEIHEDEGRNNTSTLYDSSLMQEIWKNKVKSKELRDAYAMMRKLVLPDNPKGLRNWRKEVVDRAAEHIRKLDKMDRKYELMTIKLQLRNYELEMWYEQLREDEDLIILD